MASAIQASFPCTTISSIRAAPAPCAAPCGFGRGSDIGPFSDSGRASWLGNLHLALSKLPVPVQFDITAPLTTELTEGCLEELRLSLVSHLKQQLADSHRLTILKARPHQRATLERRAYLTISDREQRFALCRLLASDSPLAVEVLRRRTPLVPREQRTCRFCERQGSVEDEIHVLLLCPSEQLRQSRERFMATAFARQPLWRISWERMPERFLVDGVGDENIMAHLAEHTHTVFQLCETVPMVVVAPEEQAQTEA
ncbi:uncharacterized protein C8Q71DRAFT_458680 [Rhodofomes roseus]|uniref:Reverse transcriptase zinc-binding domain-containing protein n=1 Tax=Rhodofomes roseus TaxID=34475 RepID=A0ABQ8KNF3_9APHY|nr:uncharacterized protein C8Q71DRAFT_458680 [Rhodofomes roseus]KAH9839683.1 hypothetical protein C8Q71DRAFT_458680 [Rhodofomes roseus]